jgi:hypothetical protein
MVSHCLFSVKHKPQIVFRETLTDYDLLNNLMMETSFEKVIDNEEYVHFIPNSVLLAKIIAFSPVRPHNCESQNTLE